MKLFSLLLTVSVRKQGGFWERAKGHLSIQKATVFWANILVFVPSLPCTPEVWGLHSDSGEQLLQGVRSSISPTLIIEGIFSCAWLDNNIWFSKIQLKWLFWKSFYFPTILFRSVRISLSCNSLARSIFFWTIQEITFFFYASKMELCFCVKFI